MSATATPADLRALRELARSYYGTRDPDRCARTVPWLDNHIADLERAVLVFRPGPTPREWVVGTPDAERMVSDRTPHAVAAIHAVIHAYGSGRAVHAASFVRAGAAAPADSLRNGLARARAWAARAGCEDLARAFHGVSIGVDGLLRYTPPRGIGKIITG